MSRAGTKTKTIDHAGDVYRFPNPKTKKIIMSRDARLMNLMWRHYKRRQNYARRQVQLYLDEDESLSLERNDPVKIELRLMGTTHPHRED